MKRFSKYLLVMLLVFMCALPALACEDNGTDGLEFKLIHDDLAYAVSKGEAEISGKVVIPSKYKGKPVMQIGRHAFSFCDGLTEIVIPSSVTTIGDYAFEGCTELSSITLPKELKRIGYLAFSGCGNLTEINIPPVVEEIYPETFYGCTKLASITVANENTYYKSDGNCLINTTYNSLVLAGNNSVIPDYVTSIESFALSNCDFKGFTMPSGITKIDYRAFFACANLESLTISSAVTEIGHCAFQTAKRLTIFAEPSGRTEGWLGGWNSDSCPVVWGCTLSSDKTHVVSFTKSETSIENLIDIVTAVDANFSAPYRAGYNFKEWNTAADGAGTAYAASDIINAADGTTLFAIWTEAA